MHSNYINVSVKRLALGPTQRSSFLPLPCPCLTASLLFTCVLHGTIWPGSQDYHSCIYIRYTHFPQVVLPDVKALQLRPELVALVQVEVGETVPVETEVFEAARLPRPGRR